MDRSEERLYDFIIFGATGYTGQYVLEEVARTIEMENLPINKQDIDQQAEEMAENIVNSVLAKETAVPSARRPVKWAVAGRNKSKLVQSLKTAQDITGKSLSEIPVIIADVEDQKSLVAMCSKAQLIINCVGPYTLYGEAVVEACLQTQTHQLDLTGELEYILKLHDKYNKEAEEKGVYIIPSVGTESCLTEMAQQYAKESVPDIVDMRCYGEVFVGKTGYSLHTGTLMSAVYTMQNMMKIVQMAKTRFTEKLPMPTRKTPKSGILNYNKDLSSWCFKMTATLPDVSANSTMDYNCKKFNKKPYHHDNYLKLGGLLTVMYALLVSTIVGVLAHFGFGRSLIEKYPWLFTLGLFSTSGPTRNQVSLASFAQHIFVEDSEGRKHRVKITGPEFAYITASTCIVQAAYTVLREASRIPERGGVLTAGIAFQFTTLLQRLKNNNLKFEKVTA